MGSIISKGSAVAVAVGLASAADKRDTVQFIST